LPDLPITLLIKNRRTRQNRQRRSLQTRSRHATLAALAVLSLLISAVIVAGALVYASWTGDLPSLQAFPALLDTQNGSLAQPTRVYDRTGERLLLTLENPDVQRRYLAVDPGAPDHFSPLLIQMAVGWLQPDFWTNSGVDWRNPLDPAPHTIAERLALDLLLSAEDAAPRRAIRMRLLAAQVTDTYGRIQVLEWYLNSAYLGHLAYGADSAAQLYFDTSASDLDASQSAVLLAALEAPALNPLDSPASALENQKTILQTLAGRGVLTPEAAASAMLVPVQFAEPPPAQASPALAFAWQAVRQAYQQVGREQVERGGLRIITSLDMPLQDALVCTARTQLARLTDRPDNIRMTDGSECLAARLLPTLALSTPLQGDVNVSAIITDPTTGEVLAMLGDADLYRENSRLTGHAPGSLLTPFIAAGAFARGLSPATLFWDVPASAPASVTDVQNPEGIYRGPLRLRNAVANTALAPLSGWVDKIGASSIWRLAELTGVSAGKLVGGAELLYGGGATSIVDIAQSYGTLANAGTFIAQPGSDGASQPVLIRFIEDPSGALAITNSPVTSQAVISPSIAWLVNSVLSDETARTPSLGYPSPLDIGRPASALVGRVAGDESLWSAGYTPQRVVVVWLGSDTDSDRLTPRMAAGLWNALMHAAVDNLSVAEWTKPPDIVSVEVCEPSGLLPTIDCPTTVKEWFISGSEPVAYDDLYRSVLINRETNRLATIFTPVEMVEKRTYLMVPPQAQEWASNNGIPSAPTLYDVIQAPVMLPDAHFIAPSLFGYVAGKVPLIGTATGDDFVSYSLDIGEGINPAAWVEILPARKTRVEDGELTVWDTSGMNGLYVIRLQVVHANQRLETALLQVTVDNTAPRLSVLSPIDQSVVDMANRTMTFQTDAADEVGIARVEWRLDGQVLGSLSSPPYTYPWRAVAGKHTLVVQAYDLAGNASQPVQIQFSVK
jgi:membrane peptidoglycan carboxypeptidase